MNRKALTFILFLNGLLLISCGPKHIVNKEVVQVVPDSVEFFKNFDPLKYDTPDKDISFELVVEVKNETKDLIDKQTEYVIINVDKDAWELEKQRTKSLAEDETHKLGYRIQLYTTTILDTALALKDSLAKKFTINVYLQHDAPHYKIRVGDFIDRIIADKFKERIYGYGYREAWVVRSEICYKCSRKNMDYPMVSDSNNVDDTKDINH